MKNQEQESKDYSQLSMNTKSIAFKRCKEKGVLSDIDESFIGEVQQYWEKHYGKKIDPTLHVALMNLTGDKTPELLPNQIMRREILPFLNDYDMTPGYIDKNLYDVFINPPRSAETAIKNVSGQYYDAYNNSIDKDRAEEIFKEADDYLIVKPSRKNNGKMIKKLDARGDKLFLNGKPIDLKRLEKLYRENFIVQKAIRQHEIMARPHPSSVNTLRMYTMRWNNEIVYISSLARYGVNNDVKDNMGAGGLCLGIKDTGEFFDIALDDRMQTYTHHPTTGVCFGDLDPLRNFEEIKQFARDCHRNILHINYISWDIAIREDGKPVFIEANFTGPLWIGQLITRKPALGNHTEEILQYVKEKMQKTQPKLMRKDRKREANMKIKSLEEENMKLRIRLEEKEAEIIRMKLSKRWQYASKLQSAVPSFIKKNKSKVKKTEPK
ncbi:sugar-transfer associated ATP-grasp domain-containing protein [Salinicoccus kekensis]|uniref:Putatie polysaccharide biosynthesis protein n=1 Tax=Salinicoccus kekensis TaxID=714307 RepID=A0A285UKN7_9STAP|nr:sugar-transfer associated ATP-grasp domain-containing protein [Salinicoccus kekensis]SOC41176.1 putatie polysaccharide biosynthesis protein [Salinicoccus kekensis]